MSVHSIRQRKRERLQMQRDALDRELRDVHTVLSGLEERRRKLESEIAELHRRIVEIDEEEQALSGWSSEGGR